MKTQQQRNEERRKAKLDLIREQIEAGTLVVRKMTPQERSKFPRRPTDDSKNGRRRRS